MASITSSRMVRTASVLLVAVAAWRMVAMARDPRSAGVDFWHFRTAQSVMGTATAAPYSREGRAEIFRATVLPVLGGLADSQGVVDGDALLARGALSREARAALQTAQIDVPLLGYEGVDTVATPFLLFAFGAATSQNYDADHLRFVILSVAAFMAGMFLFARMFGFSGSVSAALASLAGLLFLPARIDLAVGNVNSLLLAALAGSLWVAGLNSRAGDLAAGCLLGLTTCFKPSVALVLPVVCGAWLSSGAHRRAARMIAGAAVGVGIAWSAAVVAWGNPGIWLSWGRVLDEISTSARTQSSGNYSAATMLVSSVGESWAVTLGVVLCVLTGAAVMAARRSAAALSPHAAGHAMRIKTCAAGALALAVTVLSSRLAWAHYYVLLLPLILMGLAGAVEAARLRPVAKWLVRSGVTVAIIAYTGLPAALWPGLGDSRIAVMYVGAAFALFFLGLFSTLRQRSAAVAHAVL